MNLTRSTETTRRVYHHGLYHTVTVGRNAYDNGQAFTHRYHSGTRPAGTRPAAMYWWGPRVTPVTAVTRMETRRA